MSAIFGLIHRDGKPVDRDQFGRMHSALAPHGQDRADTTIRGHFALGFRLRYFMPEDRFEAQPLPLGDHSWMVAEARIDNRSELADELRISPAEALTLPDSAFVARAWLRWASDCLKHLIGAFAFAVYDTRDQSLFLAVSPRGDRTLHYFASPNVFAFSTAPKGLFALPFIRREINWNRLASYMLAQRAEPGSGFYSRIFSLPPGHTMLVTRDSTTVSGYWNPDQFRPLRFRNDQDYVEAFSSLFDRAVADSLRSDSHPGVMLSGGLDSSMVAASAALHLHGRGERLQTFTEVPENAAALAPLPGRYFDETPFVRALGEKYSNLDINLIRTPGVFFLHGLEAFFHAAEVPFRNASNRVWVEAIYRRAHETNARVLQNGKLGNLTVSWAGQWLLAGLIAAGHWRRALSEARALARTGRSRSSVRALASGALLLLPDPVWNIAHQIRKPRGAASARRQPWHRFSPLGRQLSSDLQVDRKIAEGEYNFHFRLNARSRSQTIDRLVLSPEVMRGHEAMFGIQTRSPAGDQRIVEFCFSIPEDQFLRNGVDRWLARRALADRVPPEILNNRRRGLQAADWLDRLRLARAEVIEELNMMERCNLSQYAIDLPELREMVENLTAPQAPAASESDVLREKLELGLMTGRFLRWVEQSADRPV